jgi:hypothetical protein
MAKLNGFVILENEGPQEMFDRLMVIVEKIRGLGGQDIKDHKVVKIMLDAYSLRNETVVTLIRDKKRFDMFTPSDVLGRILTFDMQREEASKRRKNGGLQAKLDVIKIKDIALKANKTTKNSHSNKTNFSKNEPFTKVKTSKKAKEKVEILSSSSESDSEDETHEEICDIALFVKKYHKGLKKEGYNVVKRRFPNKKKRTCYNCGRTEHFIAQCPHEKKENKQYKKEGRKGFDKNRKYKGKAHIGHQWDSSKDSSSEEDEKVATIAIQESFTTLRLSVCILYLLSMQMHLFKKWCVAFYLLT